jgi:2-iminobutanoate/2-iminopropanoate deaminase
MTTIQAIPFAPDRFSEYGYSPALAVGDLVFVAGQSSINDDGVTVGAGDFEAQGHQTFSNLARVLAAGGCTLSDVIKVTVFVTDISQLPTIVALRRQYFTAPYPTDSLVEVSALSRPELQIEIEAIAVRCRAEPSSTAGSSEAGG